MWPAIASRFLMELPREEMLIFEPQPHEMSDFFDVDPWDDDLPSIDINDISHMEEDPTEPGPPSEPNIRLDSSSASPNPASGKDDRVQESTVKTAFPRLVTAAEMLAREQDEVQTRLHPSKYTVGMRVEHSEYGIGEIESLSGQGKKRRATVDFPNFGKKSFVVAFCNLRLVEG